MDNTFRFPNGYDVKVLRKRDIIDCIENNITDKEVAYDVIKSLELDAATFLKQGVWAGIPHIGTIRIPVHKQLFYKKETQDIIKAAEDTLDRDKYILFRKQLAADVHAKAKRERYFNYLLSRFVNKNLKFFQKTADAKGNNYAKVLAVSLFTMRTIDYFELRTL